MPVQYHFVPTYDGERYNIYVPTNSPNKTGSIPVCVHMDNASRISLIRLLESSDLSQCMLHYTYSENRVQFYKNAVGDPVYSMKMPDGSVEVSGTGVIYPELLDIEPTPPLCIPTTLPYFDIIAPHIGAELEVLGTAHYGPESTPLEIQTELFKICRIQSPATFLTPEEGMVVAVFEKSDTELAAVVLTEKTPPSPRKPELGMVLTESGKWAIDFCTGVPQSVISSVLFHFS